MINLSPVVLPISTLGVAILSHFLKYRGSNRVDAAIKRLLDDFRKTAFPQSDPEMAHRVTLFKHSRLHISIRSLTSWTTCSPLSGWLVPYERSGEYTLKTRVAFLAPKDEPDQAEGVVGLVFNTKQCEYISKLPGVLMSSSDSIKQKYAEETCVSRQALERKLRTRRKVGLPKSYWGSPIEVDGEIWGVFLIDSRTTELPSNLKEIFVPYGQCISKLLSKR